jgi:hypothetical protein
MLIYLSHLPFGQKVAKDSLDKSVELKFIFSHFLVELQAFGVGAFEEEDDDIYALDHLSNYNRELVLEEDGDGDKKKSARKRRSRWDDKGSIGRQHFFYVS